jgi:subtilisin-like proprotein convertase family protein
MAGEWLEDRIQPSVPGGIPEIAVAAAEHYWAGAQQIDLDIRAHELAVGLSTGSGSLDVLTAEGGPLAGMTVTQWVTPDLAILRDAAPSPGYPSAELNDRISSVSGTTGVTFAAPVYQNPATGGWLVATNELIVALKPGVSAAAALADPHFAGWEPLSGTPDQFVVRAAAGYGPAVFDLNSQLHGDARFDWVAPNFYQDFRKFFTPNDPLYSSQWHLNNTAQFAGATADADVDAPEAWDVTTGSQNVIVSVVDDGMEFTHPDLAPNIAINQAEIPTSILAALTDVDGDGVISFLDLNTAVNIGAGKAVDVNANGRIDPDDILQTTVTGGWADSADGGGNGYVDDLCGWDFTTNGTTGDLNPGADSTKDAHATSVAGVAVGVGNNGLGTTGIAFRSRILPARIFGSTGASTSDANIASAVYYAAGRTRNGLGTFRAGDVMNNSWGGGSFSTAVQSAFQWASTNGRGGLGTVSFISSGNDYDSSVSFPSVLAGTVTGVVSVGASTDVETRAAYSNYGPELDFVAPSSGGVFGIVTTDRQTTSGYNTASGTAGNYTNTAGSAFGGTSSASPLAAGIGALVLAADPTLTAAQVRGLMRNTTDYIGPANPAYAQATGFNAEFGYGRVNANAAVRGVGVVEIQVLDGRTNVPDNTGSVDLGTGYVASAGVTRVIRVRNQGTQPLTLGPPAFTGPFELAAGFGSTTLTIGQSTTFVVRFRPTATGAAAGTVVFSTNDADEGTFNFALTGTGAAPSLTGRVYEDWAGNAARDATDPVIGGRTVYLDANGNGSFDPSIAPVAFPSGTLNLAIPDNNATGITNNRTVSGLPGLVVKVTVTVTITHPFDGDLTIDLIGPTGTVVRLVSNRGADGANFTGTVFDDAAGSSIASGSAPFGGTYRPEQPLSAFAGISPNGTWGLRVRDVGPADLGTLVNWTLTVTTGEVSQVTLADGLFGFGGLSAGSYSVRAVTPAGWTATAPAGGAHAVSLPAGGSVAALDFGSVRQNAVYGQVINDLDGDGVRDPGETGMGNWRVFDDRDGNGVLTGLEVNSLSDASGNFVLPGLAAGATTIRMVPQAGFRTTLSASGIPVAVVTGATSFNRDFGAVADSIAPTADVFDVTPDPRYSAVGAVTITFSEPVAGFDLADLTLTRDGGANLLTGAQTLGTADSITWTLGNLGGLTATAGNYVLTVVAGPGVTDQAQNPLAGNASDSWLVVPLPVVSIGDTSVTEGASGTVSATFAVTLSAAAVETVTISYSTADGTALLSDGDYLAASGTVTFLGGESSGAVSVNVTGDTRNEAGETFLINLASPTNAVIGDGQGVGTILNDDPVPALSINSVSRIEGNGGTTAFAFTVSVSAVSGQPVTVNFATADGTATVTDGDYQATSGTLTFAPGTTTQTVTVLATGDSRYEADETFSLTLSGATNATIAIATGVGTLTNDDVQPVLSINSVSRTEGNGGTTTFTFTVSLSPASGQTVTVGFATADGTATVADGDYTAASGILTFAPGVTTQTITVLATGDTRNEADETILVNLVAPTNAVLGTGQGVGTIANDDPLPTLSINSVTLTEGNGGATAFTFTVSLSAVSGQSVTVNYATADGTATTLDGDYSAATGTLTFAPGTTTRTFTVQATGDTRNEADETFAVALSGATNATLGAAAGTGTITNDDPLPTLSIDSVALAEGSGGTTAFTFTVSLSAVSGQTVTVGYATADGTARVADGDYTAASGTLTFAPGTTTRTFTVQAAGDTRNEADETVFVNLGTPTNAVVGTGQGVGTIANDDPLPVLSIGSVALTEGNVGSTAFTFTVSLSAVSGQAVTVNYATADGTATTLDGDYSAATGTLTFAPGTTTRTVTVSATGDARNEADETFSVALSGPTNATLGAAAGTGTIANDDPLPTLLIDSVALAEGNGGATAFTFTVSLSAVSGQAVTVNYATADGTATLADGDYAAATGTLTFAPGTTTRTITVLAAGDDTFETDESFAVVLGPPTNALVAAGTGTAQVTNDDTVPAVSLGLSGSPFAEAGGRATVTISLSNPSYLPVTVAFESGGSAAASDYASASASVTVPAGQRSAVLTLSGRDDPADENDETVVVGIDSVTNGTVAAASSVTATLTDDDLPGAAVDSVDLVEDTAYAAPFGALLGNDNAAPGTTVELVGPAPAGAAFTFDSDGAFTYSPAADVNGLISFQYRVRNPGGEVSAPATVRLLIAPVNDSPRFVSGVDQVDPRHPGPRTIPGWATGIAAGPAGEGGQGLTFLVSTDKPELFLVQPAIDPATGTLTYTPNSGFGTAVVTVRLTDDGGTAQSGNDTSAPRSFSITVHKYHDDDTPTNQYEVGILAAGSGDAGAVVAYRGDASQAYTASPVPGSGARTATADVTGDGVPDLIAASGPGVRSRVVVLDGATRAEVRTLLPFEDSFTGGLFVAAADLDGDGRSEIVVSPDVGGGGRVTVFGGRTGAPVADFFGIDDPNFRGGARVAVGDLNADGRPDVVVAAGFGGGPRVAVFDGTTVGGGTPRRVLNDFFGFPGTDAINLRNGTYVASGDVDGDGYAELVLGGGPGGAPRVFVLSGRMLAAGDVAGAQAAPVANFFVANDVSNFGGVRVAVKDLDGDARADVAVGSGDGVASHVRLYYGSAIVGASGEPAGFRDLDPFGQALAAGVYVG